MVSRAKTLDGLIFLHDFDAKQISKQQSEDLRKEFARLVLLRWQTVARYCAGVEVDAARAILAEQGQKALANGSKRKNNMGLTAPAQS